MNNCGILRNCSASVVVDACSGYIFCFSRDLLRRLLWPPHCAYRNVEGVLSSRNMSSSTTLFLYLRLCFLLPAGRGVKWRDCTGAYQAKFVSSSEKEPLLPLFNDRGCYLSLMYMLAICGTSVWCPWALLQPEGSMPGGRPVVYLVCVRVAPVK